MLRFQALAVGSVDEDMDTFAQLNAAVAGRYAVDREIGAGGMATVYLARDLRHSRRVALKVLNPELGAVLGGERFLAEIQVTANLQHPNLLPLFDSGEAGGLLYYVMPFIEGESLRARLVREKQLPVDEALRITAAVADALDYAHRHGVIHRDLKPENILLHEGRPLVADFGIALAVSKAGGVRVTQTGLSLGTPQYMSPEQATGDRVIDARSDVYSLAAVLYEMLTGEPPHTGPTSQAIIARVLTDKPRPVRMARETVAPHVEAAIEKALSKLAADRYPTARAFADALEGRIATVATPAATPAARGSRWRSALVPTATAIVTGAAVWGWMAMRAPIEQVVRFAIPLAATHSTWVMLRGNPVAVSPDGKMIVYVVGYGSAQRLAVRSLDDSHTRVIEGADGGKDAVFSPDGKWIAFNSGDQIKKVLAQGGAVTQVADLRSYGGPFWGLDWGPTDSLAVSANGRIVIVSASGGSTRLLAPSDTVRDRLHVWPRWSPSGRWVLFTEHFGSRAQAHVVARSVKDGRAAPLSVAGIMPLGFIDDHLVYSSTAGGFLATKVDDRSGQASGLPVQLGDSAVGGYTFVKAALSRSGSLVFVTGSIDRQLALFNVQQRTVQTLITQTRPYTWLRFSPDGKQLALNYQSFEQEPLAVYDFASKTLSRLTIEGDVNNRPEWSPDGKRVLFKSEMDGGSLRSVAADGSAPAEQMLPGVNNVWEGAISPDGRYLAYRTGTVGNAVIWLKRLADSTSRAKPVGETTLTNWAPRFSPNSQWLAYASNRGGTRHVYVQAVSGSGALVQVSDVGEADSPLWSPDGRRIYYSVDGQRVVVATLDPGPPFRVLSREILLDGGFFLSTGHATFDITRDGKELLLLKNISSDAELVVIHNWREQVRAKIAARR